MGSVWIHSGPLLELSSINSSKADLVQVLDRKHVTSHAKTYTNGFPFSNGKPFTTRVLPVLKNIAPVRTAWVTRAVEALTRSTGLITRSIDAPTRSHGLITRSAEAPTRSNSLTTRAVEAPTRSHGLVTRLEKIALHPFAWLE